MCGLVVGNVPKGVWASSARSIFQKKLDKNTEKDTIRVEYPASNDEPSRKIKR
jgi:hypothetical protein